MECPYTCFDRVMHLVKPASKRRQIKDIVYLIQYDGLNALLDYCVQEELMTSLQSHTIFDGIVMWEDLDGNYYEEDHDKLMLLHERLGITQEVFNKYKR